MPLNAGVKSTTKQCAYCGKSEHSATKEHIIPNAIAKTLSSRGTFHVNKELFFDGDATIKDTCSLCNNVKLGELDNRLTTAMKPWIGKWLRDADFSVTLHVDWQTLARWLLKVSFNSARATKAHDLAALTAQRKFMLGVGEVPPKLLILGGLVRSHRLTPREKQLIRTEQDWLDPEMNRTAHTVLPRLPEKLSISRAVLIQHLAFMILKPVRGYNLGVNLRRLEQATGFRVVERKVDNVKLGPTKDDALDVVEASIRAKFDAYRKEYGSQ
ncbi:hypothetical protein HUW63_03375 [Myxococcus sp. AM001]|nr:hypothetical protein [Myxococcus sp. AM001]